MNNIIVGFGTDDKELLERIKNRVKEKGFRTKSQYIFSLVHDDLTKELKNGKTS